MKLGFAAVNPGGQVAGYTALMAAASFAAFAKLFILAGTLGQAGFGHYVFITSTVQFGLPFFSLGISEGFARQLPLLLGSGSVAEANRLRDQCLSALVGIASVIVLVGVLFGGIVAATKSVPGGISLVTATVYAACFALYSFGLRDLRGRLFTTSFALVMLLRGIADVMTSTILAPRIGAEGVLAFEAATLIALFMVTVHLVSNVSLGSIDRGSLTTVMREGFLISVSGVAANAASVGDRIVVGAVLPKAAAGLYSFHLLVANAAFTTYNIIVQYVSPKLLQGYGASGDRGAVFRKLLTAFVGLTTLAFVSAPLFPPGIHFLANRFYPEYEIQPLLLAAAYVGAALSLANVFPIGLLVLGRLRMQVVINFSAALIVVVGLGSALLFERESLALYGIAFAVGRGAFLLTSSVGLSIACFGDLPSRGRGRIQPV